MIPRVCVTETIFKIQTYDILSEGSATLCSCLSVVHELCYACHFLHAWAYHVAQVPSAKVLHMFVERRAFRVPKCYAQRNLWLRSHTVPATPPGFSRIAQLIETLALPRTFGSVRYGSVVQFGVLTVLPLLAVLPLSLVWHTRRAVPVRIMIAALLVGTLLASSGIYVRWMSCLLFPFCVVCVLSCFVLLSVMALHCGEILRTFLLSDRNNACLLVANNVVRKRCLGTCCQLLRISASHTVQLADDQTKQCASSVASRGVVFVFLGGWGSCMQSAAKKKVNKKTLITRRCTAVFGVQKELIKRLAEVIADEVDQFLTLYSNALLYS